MTELANTAAWLDTLYGRCRAEDGQLVVIASSRKRIASVHHVGSGASLVKAARKMQSTPGCYAKINLMDYEAMVSRAKKIGRPVVGAMAEVKTVVSIHLDVDAGKSGKYMTRSGALWALRKMPLPPTLVINSNGSSGGFHAYWCLSRPHRIADKDDLERIRRIAKGWQDRLRGLLFGKLDSTSNLDRVLRCVGVPRCDGGRVCMESCDFGALYQLEDFSK